MNEWYIDNAHNINTIFNETHNFIIKNNISTKISLEQLYNRFVHICYKGSYKYGSRDNIYKYKIHKKNFNYYYEDTLSSDFFDIIYDIKLNIKEHNDFFLDKFDTNSIQNFFENWFDNSNLNTTKNNQYENDTNDYDNNNEYYY